MDGQRLKLGRIGYINCTPVYGAIDRGIVHVPAELVLGTPAELSELLVAGQLDVSVISTVEYARHASALRLLPGIAISSEGPVRSVALFSNKPARALHDALVVLSSSSRTSVALLDLLCREVWCVRPRFIEAPAEAADLDELEALPHEAVLAIGDAALMLTARGTYAFRYDLGEEWWRWTRLPFVFGVWAARRDADQAAVARVHDALLASRAWGLDHLSELMDEARRATGVSHAECAAYLEGLGYVLTERHVAGLTTFFRKLSAHGLVPPETVRLLELGYTL